ncbi:MAG: hypothetical protein JEZ03_16390 [Bacteroidales bacterium]|nr:hypothetical protein [Bacteroidales bacterium]
MRNSRLILFLFVFIHNTILAQHFEIPDEVISELEYKAINVNDTIIIEYLIKYPEQFSDSLEHPVFIGLSGGSATNHIVSYCYYAMFRTSYLKNHVCIFPIAPENKTLGSLNEIEMLAFIKEIKHLQFCRMDQWITAKSSNGGIAVFDFAKASPEQFSGLITLPGVLSFKYVPKVWSNYKVLLPIGQHNTCLFGSNMNWQRRNDSAYNQLEPIVKTI